MQMLEKLCLLSLTCLYIVPQQVYSKCPKRSILTDNTGNITLHSEDYLFNTYCQWLIQASDQSQFINIEFHNFLTECDYDYLYIYDGETINSKLLGAFSGSTVPDNLSASSGSVLVVFYSDLNYKPEGGSFHLTYTVTDCKFGCSPCSDHRCVCPDKRVGLDCSVPICTSNIDCYYGGQCMPVGNSQQCDCLENTGGRFCSLDLRGTSTYQGIWTELAPSGVGFVNRAGHTSEYDADTRSIWVYGGTNLYDVTDDIVYFSFQENAWKMATPLTVERPAATYGHKSASTNGCMFIVGGRNLTSTLSQFWRYCYLNSTWSQLEDHPEHLSDHTLTLVESRWLYTVGGLTDTLQLTNKVWKFDIYNPDGGWQEVITQGGNAADLRVAGHTTVYYKDLNSLFLFGGHKSYIARFTAHSNDIYMFNIKTNHWINLEYSGMSEAPPPVAFHSSHIMGNYMIVYGGQVKRSTAGCLSNRIYAYHFACNKWIDYNQMYLKVKMSNEPGDRPDSKGRHSHSSLVINGNILVVIGGYRGNVLGDMWSYQVLDSVAKNTNNQDYGLPSCQVYTTAEACFLDAECFWCGSPPYSGCTAMKNLKDCKTPSLGSCSGLCSGITDCQSCVQYSTSVQASTWPSLRQIDACVWSTPEGTCSSMSSITDPGTGWWSADSVNATTQSQCVSKENRPAGVRYAVYSPATELPEKVYQSRTATIDWRGKGLSSIKFFLHPPDLTSVTEIPVKASAYNNEVNIAIYELSSDQPLVSATVTPQNNVLQVYTLSEQISLDKTYLVDMRAHMTYYVPNKAERYSLTWDTSTSSLKDSVIGYQYLEPYYSSGTDCALLSTCSECQLDVSCGWCPTTKTCISRAEQATLSSGECGGDNPTHWVITDPGRCLVCSDHVSCNSCLDSPGCVWNSTSLDCMIKPSSINQTLSSAIVNDMGTCPPGCNDRNNCTECLQYKDSCIWCESSNTCNEFSPFLVSNSFGQCKSWLENYHEEGLCTSCESYTTCSECLEQSTCGWCGNDFNPAIGKCTRGDYSTDNNCTDLLLSSLDVEAIILSHNYSLELVNSSNIGELSSSATFSYNKCPNIRECLLGLSECLEHSECLDTDESYECPCVRGYEGDGKIACNQTCYHDCVFGTCGGPPDYQCVCDLGWTGVSCDENCGCNNHSTCVNGTGKCDLCQENSYGEFCEFCLPGSYGNATIYPGCLTCECNGHGVASLGMCDGDTGECYCQEGFVGDQCQYCDVTSYGDPRNGSLCYDYTLGRRVIYNATSSDLDGITSFSKYYITSYTRWIITPFSDLDSSHPSTGDSNPVLMTVTVDQVNIACPLGALYVYDGLNTDDGDRYITALCSESNLPMDIDIRSGYATLVFYGNSTESEYFTAHYTVYTDCNIRNSSSCPTPNLQCQDNLCVCDADRGGVACSHVICPNDCSGNGTCDQELGLCICNQGFSGDDCSLSSILLINTVYSGALIDGSPPARHGFKAVVCDTVGLVMFGGLSTEKGFLSDIWSYDGKGWARIIPSGVSPAGRYHHAAACVNDVLYVSGGLVLNSGSSQPQTSRQFWAFSFSTSSWLSLDNLPVDIAGHSMNLISSNQLLVVGGYSTASDWNNRTFTYDITTHNWVTNVNGTGSVPAGLMLHSAVYHSPSNSLYVHGGYRYYIDTHSATNETWFYDISIHRWYKRPNIDTHPGRRYLHTAVQLEYQMVVLGGRTTGYKYSPDVWLYNYACDNWHLLPGLHIESTEVTAVVYKSRIHLVQADYPEVKVLALEIPADICSIYSGSTGQYCTSIRGCHSCRLADGSYICFDKSKPTPAQCDLGNNTLIVTSSETCDSSIVSARNCNLYKDCTQCLTAWPYHGKLEQECKWCSFCSVGKCIPVGNNCSVDNPCSRSQSDKLTSEECLEHRCRSATCSQCNTEMPDSEGCIWTRNFMRSSEFGRKANTEPFDNWNCVTGLLTSLSKLSVWTSPPYKCPTACSQRDSCQSCLSSDGGTGGGVAACYWSSRLNSCLSPSLLPLMCDLGTCAPLYESGSALSCPSPCSNVKECGKCLSQANCGWCSVEGSSGYCTEGGLDIPEKCSTSLNFTSWSYYSCPAVNECNSTWHTCDLESEDCIDLEVGYHCACKGGYKLIEGECIPQCPSGCDHGTCVKPDVCDCNFSWTGFDCSVECQCNEHSDCAGPDQLTNCTQCMNNTRGDQCGLCEKLSVGIATDGGVCESCYMFCNHHSSICMQRANYELAKDNQTLLVTYPDWITLAPSSRQEVLCINCSDHTTGDTCATCQTGYYSRTADPTDPCLPCPCQGHAFTCDVATGLGCECQNNTKSADCTSESPASQSCHLQQCSQCDDYYVGTPTDGHQCYFRMLVDSNYCITRGDIHGVCSIVEPLYLGQAALYAVFPKFSNVFIKVYLYIDEGEVDVYLSKSDDFFKVSWNKKAQSHDVELDPAYTVISSDGASNRKRRETTSTAHNSTYSSYMLDVPDSFTYHASVSDEKGVYIIPGVKSRLVITIPDTSHDLNEDKFYVILIGKDISGSRGTVLFRQDQVRIDLFVFFAVFFSCFFKFLSVCVIIWKIKSMYDQQRIRVMRQAELGQMAARPCGSILILFREYIQSEMQTKHKNIQLTPLASEFTEDGVAVVGTVIFEMPGGKSAPVRAVFGTSLMTLRVLYPNKKSSNDRQKEKHQAAIQTTEL